MNVQPYKYKVFFGEIEIVSRLEDGYNVFNNLKDAKAYAIKYFYEADNQQLKKAYKKKIQSITKQRLFDDFFKYAVKTY